MIGIALELVHLGRGTFGQAGFANPCGALWHTAVKSNRVDVDQIVLIFGLHKCLHLLCSKLAAQRRVAAWSGKLAEASLVDCPQVLVLIVASIVVTTDLDVLVAHWAVPIVPPFDLRSGSISFPNFGGWKFLFS